MTISTRVALGISAAAFSLSMALAPAAFAEDPMSQDIDFRNGASRNVGVKKDTVRDTVKKDNRAKKDGPSKWIGCPNCGTGRR